MKILLFCVLVHSILVAGKWELIDTTKSPTGRTSVAITTLISGEVLIFGGTDGEQSSSFKGDTWLFDGQWTEQPQSTGGSTPEPRAISAMAAYGDGAILFGGLSGVSQWGSLNDTWFWTPKSGWTELKLDVAPPGRAYHMMQSTEQGVVLFGGRTFDFERWDESMNDLWLFDGTKWTEIPEDLHNQWPRGRYSAAFTSISSTELLLFGGAGNSEFNHLDDTWKLTMEGSSNVSWSELQDWPKPRGRWCAGAAKCGSGALMTGGSIDYRISSNETWIWKPTVFPSIWGHEHDVVGEWKLEDMSESALSGYGMTPWRSNVRPYLKGVLLFGGVAAPSSDPTKMHFTNQTLFWDCSDQK